MTLREKQSLFAAKVPGLIVKAISLGFEVTLGEVYRSPEEAERLAKAGKGIARSLHCDKLAIDINLFKDGKYLSSGKKHKELGEWWEAQGGAWGGRFGDPNHYSLEWKGRK